MNELPHGWAWVDVEDLAANEPSSLTDGPFGSNLKTSHYTDSGPRVIRLQNIGDGAFVDERAHISEEHFQRLRRHEARANDVVIAMLGERLPRACVVPDTVGPAIVKADCVRLRVESDLSNPRYVTHALNSHQVRSQAEELVHGVGRPRLGLKWLRSLKIPLAPVPEQHRVVEAIESHLTRLDDAMATLERVQRSLKRYRASVLKAAVEGRLVPTEAELARAEGRDYEPASVLLERILAERRRRWEENELAKMKAAVKTPKDDRWKAKYKQPAPPDTHDLPDLPEGWAWATVESISTKVVDGVHKKPDYVAAGVPFVTVRNLTAGPGISFAGLRYITAEDHERFIARANPEPGDLLISKDGTLGVVRAVRTEEVFSIFVSVALIKPVRREMTDFLEIALSSPVVQQQMVPKGSGLQHIHLEDLRADCVPLPPLAEAARIYNAVQRQLSIVDEALKNVERERLRCERLRQSILKWAFEGRLVDQDPSHEPASALLERIKAERAAASTSTSNKKPRRKGNSANA